jgi:hypothetical protein
MLNSSRGIDAGDDMSELPPPEGQTFDEAERLEALQDLPPPLWSQKEYMLSANNNGTKFSGLWPNTGPRYTKVKLENGDTDLRGLGEEEKPILSEYHQQHDKLHLSGDPSAPDPLHPDVSADYRKAGSAVRGVAAQSNVTHPVQIIGKVFSFFFLFP